MTRKTHQTHHLQCGCPHDAATVLALAEVVLLDNAIKGFLREAARTTVNQLRAAIAIGETEKAAELAAWLMREDWI